MLSLMNESDENGGRRRRICGDFSQLSRPVVSAGLGIQAATLTSHSCVPQAWNLSTARCPKSLEGLQVRVAAMVLPEHSMPHGLITHFPWVHRPFRPLTQSVY